MSIDRDDLRMILTERYGREYDIPDWDLDDILALDDAAPCDDLRARLANIAELRDEMHAVGGVVWIDDLDEFLAGHPGAALNRAEIALVLGWAGTHGSAHGLTDAEAALAARLEAQQ